MTDGKPDHLSGNYGAWFKDPLLAAAYPARPPYPDGLISLLITLIQDSPGTVLDIGCGTGELARRLSPSVEHVHAVDFSEAMLALARQLPAGNADNIRWTLGAVEDAALTGPYALVTAGECLHWMDFDVVMARLAQVLSPKGRLAIIDRTWDTDAWVWQRILPIIERHTPVRNYRPFNLIGYLAEHELFDVEGQQRFGPDPWRPTLAEYLECRHSQRGLSRTHMGAAAAASFDAEVTRALEELSSAGVIAAHEGRLELGVAASVTWGRPRAPKSTGMRSSSRA